MIGKGEAKSDRMQYCRFCDDYTGVRFIFLKGGIAYFKCSNCGLIFTTSGTEHPLVNYDRAYYLRDTRRYFPEPGTPSYERMRRGWMKRIRRLKAHARGRRLLDVGCGTGMFISIALEEGFDAWGFEVQSAAEIAAQNSSIKGRIYTGESLECLKGETFNVLTMWGVLEHLDSPALILGGVGKLLNKGGIFALSTPNISSMNRWLFGTKWRFFIPSEHVIHFNKENLKKGLEQAGFRIVKINTVFSQPALREGLYSLNTVMRHIFMILAIPLLWLFRRPLEWIGLGDTLEIIAVLR